MTESGTEFLPCSTVIKAVTCFFSEPFFNCFEILIFFSDFKSAALSDTFNFSRILRADFTQKIIKGIPENLSHALMTDRFMQNNLFDITGIEIFSHKINHRFIAGTVINTGNDLLHTFLYSKSSRKRRTANHII
ncbi:MAG: hypothetical protein IKB77_04655 [Lentisphaeria bacterium]|nr:hypothetical protein [Lentisphaeria bacterium]